MKNRTEKRELRLWAVSFWLVVWQLASMWLDSELLLVSPVKVLVRLAQMAGTVIFWKSIYFTLSRIALGFFSAVLAGRTRSRTSILNVFFRMKRRLPTVPERKRRSEIGTMSSSLPREKRSGRRPGAAGGRSAAEPRPRRALGPESDRRPKNGPKSGSGGNAVRNKIHTTGSDRTNSARNRTIGRIPRLSSTPSK